MSYLQIPLQIGMQLKVRSLESLGQPAHATRVEDVADETIVVQRPTHNYQPVRMPKGSRIELLLSMVEPSTAAGKYRAETVVVDEIFQSVPLLRLAVPEQWERSQLRKFFRVPTTISAEVRTLQTGDDWVSARTRDLSGGGCRLAVPAPLERGQTLEINLTLPSGPLQLKGTVTRIEGEKGRRGEHTVVGIKFIDIEEKQREQLIRYGFERQIELRKKGIT